MALAALVAGLPAAACDLGGAPAPSRAPTPVVAPAAPAYVAPVVPQLPPAIALPARITDVAGTGALGVAGDGGPAAQAQFRSVGGVAVDGAGIIYISDPSASTIRRIQLTGVIELLAGTGVRGARGDGGQARAAELTDPGRMLVDGAGNLYVAEADRVRRIGTDGVVSSILGDGRPGVDGDGGPAAFARTAGNAGMAVDGDGNLFIAERAAHRIRRIDARGLVATAAGTGSPGVAGDGGPAVRAQLDQPVDVEIDGNGNLLIAELGGNRIRVVSPDGIIRTLAGTGRTGYAGDGGPAVSAELSGPQAVVIDGARQIFIADWNNRRIRRVGVDGRIDTIAGSAAGAPESGRVAVETRLALPLELAPTPDGGLLVVEQGTRRLRKLTPGVPTPTPTIAATAPAVTSSYRAPAPSLPFPPAVAAAPIAEIFAGADKAGFEGDGGSRLSAVFNSPRGIAVDGGGQVLVADTGNHRVRQIGLDGGVRTIAGTGAPGFAGDGAIATQAQLNRPAALVVDSAGAVYVADAGNFRIRRIAPDGVISTIAGGSRPGSGGDGGPAQAATFTEPTGLALDGRGTLFVADGPAHRVRAIRPDGLVTAFAGTGAPGTAGDGGPATTAEVGFPQRAVVDAFGQVLISQLQNDIVRRVDPKGVIATLAGAVSGASAQEGPAERVRIDDPVGLAVDRNGHVYVVESAGGTVTRIDRLGNAVVLAGNPTGTGTVGGPAREVSIPTPLDFAIGPDGTGYLLEARGVIWRIASTLAGGGTPSAAATPTPTPSATPTIQPAQIESADVVSATLAQRLDSGQGPLDPTTEFRAGERVNVSITYARVARGTRIGLRWIAGSAVQGQFLTDPVPGSGRITYGFYFELSPSTAPGPWKVEVLVGESVSATLPFTVVAGAARSRPASG